MTLLASFTLDSYMLMPLNAGIFITSYSKQNVSDVTFESTIIYWSFGQLVHMEKVQDGLS